MPTKPISLALTFVPEASGANPQRRRGWSARAAAMLAIAALAGACSTWFADPATCLADDIIDNARALQRSDATERIFTHAAAASPNACSKNYRVTLFGGPGAAAVGFGCDDAQPGVFNFTTNRITKEVSLSAELSVTKAAAATLRVTLRKSAGGVQIVRIE